MRKQSPMATVLANLKNRAKADGRTTKHGRAPDWARKDQHGRNARNPA